ncbi:hypothetical protein [Sinomonas gamaensis]|uniref:hypothetical protein n=1 Tax=Sinomonas gamaensis TaxID=2565624 RepID=UPI001108DACC|nr:hypothetical protein [Sinomonas gamaensis]
MSVPGGIVIDEKKIKKVVSQAWTTLGFFCVPDYRSAHVTAEDIDRAIGHIRVPDHTDQRFHAVGVRNGIGIFMTPVLGYKNALEIAEAIAESIAPLGFTGTITARDDQPGRRPNDGRRGYSAAISSVEAAIDHRDVGLNFRPLRKNTDRWDVNSPVFRQIVEALAAWATAHASGTILAGVILSMTECEPHQVTDIITRCCEDIGWADLLFETADGGDWYAHFSMEGWVLVGTEIKGRTDDEPADELFRLLAELAPLYDYAEISGGGWGPITPSGAMPQHLMPVPDSLYMAANHGFIRNSIPGIFAAQVLGPDHPDLQPSDRWHITPLEAGRRLVTLDTCQEWLAGNIDAEDLRALREANRDLLFEEA